MDLDLSFVFCLPGRGHCIIGYELCFIALVSRRKQEKGMICSKLFTTINNSYEMKFILDKWVDVNAVDINTEYYYPIYFKALKLIREQLAKNFVFKARQSISNKW